MSQVGKGKMEHVDYSKGYKSLLRKTNVVIHSSSHLGTHRGVHERVLKGLGDRFSVKIEAWGGRQWDLPLIKFFSNRIVHEIPALHIILLGDNDLRNTRLDQSVNPFIKQFGEAVGKFDHSKCTIFVNGLIPFPIFNKPNSCDLIENFNRYTTEMSMLIGASGRVTYVPMRPGLEDFCKTKKISTVGLFNKDKVHLNDLGEGFLVDHLINQAKCYRVQTASNVLKYNMKFYLGTANRDRTGLENFKVISREYRLTNDPGKKPIKIPKSKKPKSSKKKKSKKRR